MCIVWPIIFQVYFVTIDKKSKAVSLSHAKDNKVELRADGGGWVPLHLLHLARWARKILKYFNQKLLLTNFVFGQYSAKKYTNRIGPSETAKDINYYNYTNGKSRW